MNLFDLFAIARRRAPARPALRLPGAPAGGVQEIPRPAGEGARSVRVPSEVGEGALSGRVPSEVGEGALSDQVPKGAGEGARSWSYDELLRQAEELAAALARWGLRRGDRVACLLGTGPGMVRLHLALLRLGAVLVPLNPAYRQREIGHILSDAAPRLLVAEPALRQQVEEVPAERRASVEGVVWLDELDGWRGDPGELPRDGGAAGGDDPAMLLYTSGTTGASKGAVISHNNLLATVTALLAAWDWRHDDVLLLALPLFHVHGLVVGLDCALAAGATVELRRRFDAAAVVSELTAGAATMFFGVPTLYVRLVEELRRRDGVAAADRAGGAAGRGRDNGEGEDGASGARRGGGSGERRGGDAQGHALGIGQAQDGSTRGRPAGPGAGIAGMRLFCSGSAPLPPEVFTAFRELTGHAILERYGMTEAGIILSNPYLGPRRPGEVGGPLPGVSVRIVGAAGGPDGSSAPADLAGPGGPGATGSLGGSCVAAGTGSAAGADRPDGTGGDGAAAAAPRGLPPGMVGELLVRGANVFSGYWQAPEKTAAAFVHDAAGRRWFRTGDLARQDPATGAFSLLGRRHELIISGGFNVYPREIEETLLAFPGVREAAVVGRPHAEWGEVPVAFLVADPAPDEAALLAHCRDQLAGFKVPRQLHLVAALPRNALGKLQKHLLP